MYENYWTPVVDQDNKECNMILAFIRQITFLDTQKRLCSGNWKWIWIFLELCVSKWVWKQIVATVQLKPERRQTTNSRKCGFMSVAQIKAKYAYKTRKCKAQVSGSPPAWSSSSTRPPSPEPNEDSNKENNDHVHPENDDENGDEDKNGNNETDQKQLPESNEQSSKAVHPCADENCQKTFTFLCKMASFMAKHHPNFEYQCHHCINMYKFFNGWKKHKHYHGRHEFECDDCGAVFQFPAQLVLHVPYHTSWGIQVPLICLWPRVSWTRVLQL